MEHGGIFNRRFCETKFAGVTTIVHIVDSPRLQRFAVQVRKLKV